MSELVVVQNDAVPYRTNITSKHHRWHADEPEDLGGQDTAPTPYELLLSALGSCIAITLRMYAARKTWDLQGLTVALTLSQEKKQDGNLVTHIKRQFSFDGNLDDDQKERLIQIAAICPVSKMLTNTIEMHTI